MRMRSFWGYLAVGGLVWGCAGALRTDKPSTFTPETVLASTISIRQPVHPHRPKAVNYGLPPNELSAKQAIAKLEADNDPMWVRAKQEHYKTIKELRALDRQISQQGGLESGRIAHGDRSSKRVALTFDDGPHTGFTPRLLEILKQYDVKATFFVVGTQAEKHPELIRLEAGEGHLVENHTYHHVSLTKIPAKFVAEEIAACSDVLSQILGRQPEYFRPPGGDYDRDIARIAYALGCKTVLWTDDPLDFKHPNAQALLQRTLRRVRPGGIVLLHDGVEETVDMLPKLIETLRAKGYEFVTIDKFDSFRWSGS